MTMVQRKELEKQMEKVLKKFNDDECGGGYLYFIHREGKEETLVQLDLCDYSSIDVCGIEDIESVEFIEEEESILISFIEGTYEGIDYCWIDEMGCQM